MTMLFWGERRKREREREDEERGEGEREGGMSKYCNAEQYVSWCETSASHNDIHGYRVEAMSDGLLYMLQWAIACVACQSH